MLRFIAALCLLLSVSIHGAGAPTNDIFGFARQISGAFGVENATNVNAGYEFNEPPHAGSPAAKSLWWVYVPAQNGLLALSTEGSSFNTRLAVYAFNNTTDRALADLKLISQNDDAPGDSDGHSDLTVGVFAGKKYFIVVDGVAGASGTIQLTYSFSAGSVYALNLFSTNGAVNPPSGAYPANSSMTVTATTTNRYLGFRDFRVSYPGTTPMLLNRNPYTFTLLSATTIEAEFGPMKFADDFERSEVFTPGIPWQATNWVVEYQMVTNAAAAPAGHLTRVARTGPTANSSINTLRLITDLTATSATNVGSFEYRVSTEAHYDTVEFRLDGVLLATWSGEVPWSEFKFPIPARVNPRTLEWRFKKDGSRSAGLDAFFMDTLDVPIVGSAAPLPINVSLDTRTNPARILVNGPRGIDVILETAMTVDATEWTQLGQEETLLSSGATFEIPPLTGTRYFRVRQL